MASAPRKPPASTQAEIALLPSLKNCLVNLPSSLVNVLLNSNAVVQNVVVELSFKAAAGSDGKPGKQQSVFVGWTGMRSQTRRAGVRQDQGEVAGVEVDGTFGRGVGLREGLKVRFVLLHVFCFVFGLGVWSLFSLIFLMMRWLKGMDVMTDLWRVGRFPSRCMWIRLWRTRSTSNR